MKIVDQHTNILIERCKKGDKAAQFTIYKQYYKAMYNTALRIVNDSFEAEDIMQESFLAAFTKLHTFSENVTFGAWLKKIVINNSLTALKKNNRIENNRIGRKKTEKNLIIRQLYLNDLSPLAKVKVLCLICIITQQKLKIICMI